MKVHEMQHAVGRYNLAFKQQQHKLKQQHQLQQLIIWANANHVYSQPNCSHSKGGHQD